MDSSSNNPQPQPAYEATDRWRVISALCVTCLALIVAWLAPPIAQDVAYHDFADKRTLFGVPNFWNVITNLPFLATGIWGFFVLRTCRASVLPMASIFSGGLVLICFGSSWYHLAPDNATLFWDRLTMTVSFMAFFAFTLAAVAGSRVGVYSLWPLLIAGTASVIYWSLTEAAGQGDLRPYGLVQFLPGMLILIFLLLFPNRFFARKYLWFAMGAYTAAKLLEWQDGGVWSMGEWLSGHSLKHLAAALGGYYGIRALMGDKPDKQAQKAAG